MSIISFTVAILPVFLIGLFIYLRDKIKDPSKFLFKLFCLGILSSIPTIIVGLLLDIFFPNVEDMNFIQLFIYVFGSIALVEEFFKWLFLYKFSYNHKEFDSTYDMIVYSVFVSLGFACFENILYVLAYGTSAGIFRAVSAVPAHACFGIIMGMYLSIAKIHEIKGNISFKNKFKMLSLFVPVIMHGIYDFCAINGGIVYIIFFFVFILLVDIYCIINVLELSHNSVKFRYKNNYCTNCGKLVNSNYCTNCGNKNE